MMIFRRSRTWQSIIFGDVVEHLVAHYKDMLFWKGSLLSLPQIALYERAIGNFGSIQSVWAFIDGTVRGICRSGEG